MMYINLPHDRTKYTDEEFKIMVKEMLFCVKGRGWKIHYEYNVEKKTYIEWDFLRSKEVSFSYVVKELTDLFFKTLPIRTLLYKPERNFIKNTIEELIKLDPRTYLKTWEDEEEK